MGTSGRSPAGGWGASRLVPIGRPMAHTTLNETLLKIATRHNCAFQTMQKHESHNVEVHRNTDQDGADNAGKQHLMTSLTLGRAAGGVGPCNLDLGRHSAYGIHHPPPESWMAKGMPATDDNPGYLCKVLQPGPQGREGMCTCSFPGWLPRQMPPLSRGSPRRRLAGIASAKITEWHCLHHRCQQEARLSE